MAVTSGFFNSMSGDRKYNAEQIGNYFEGLVSNGVFENVGNKLVVTATSGLNISVGTGRAMINCHWLKNDTDLSFTLDPGDVQYDRYDYIILKLDLNNSARSISILVRKGTPSINAQIAPNLERTNEVYELCLAAIKVTKNATSITQTNIADLRGTSYCGYVTGLIEQVDTSDLFLQYQTALEEYYQRSVNLLNSIIEQRTAEFDAWFQTLTDELRVDTKLVKYENVVQIDEDTYDIAIGIPEFAEGDILLVHVNGVFLNETTEFVIADYEHIQTHNEIEAGNEVTFIVIKNTIGTNSDHYKIDFGGYPISVTTIQPMTIGEGE